MSVMAYHQLKAAQALFAKSYQQLDTAEAARVHEVAQRYAEIEAAVLGSDEAGAVSVPDTTLNEALAEVRARYQDEDDFQTALTGAGLDADSLAVALHRDVQVEQVLATVAARVPAVDTAEAEKVYSRHVDRFRVPERRSARHILITINPDLPDNTRAAAQRRIQDIAERLYDQPQCFEEQALKHSECPTALHGGRLGTLPPGELYPQLDRALFAMQPGDISTVLESELGFHILRCDAIEAARTLSFEEVRPALCQRLTEKRARKATQIWLRQCMRAKSTLGGMEPP